MFILIPTLLLITAPQLQLEPIHESLVFNEPVQVLFDGVNNNIMYVVEKDGVIRQTSTKKDETNKPAFLDITDRVEITNDEEGLLSAVFHPKYGTNGKVYAWYSSQKPKRSILSEFTKEHEQQAIQKSSERIIIEVREPWGNHNGGTILFGSDGYLYLGIGDGGASNDPHQHGQNKNTLLGTIIRIDVDKYTHEQPYVIPKDNPLVGQGGIREEIWAWGLRNPWRMSFDRETGELWVGDVGQNAWEEINIVSSGGNYGWNLMEGKHSFKKQADNPPPTIEPIHEYGRRQGGSITGGYVYRGTEIPELVGSYIYSDYLSKKIWILSPNKDNDPAFTSTRIAKKTPISITSFGETPGGEIIACGPENPYSSKGKIYRLVPTAPSLPTTSIIR